MPFDSPGNYLEVSVYLTNVFITLYFMSRFLFQLRVGNKNRISNSILKS